MRFRWLRKPGDRGVDRVGKESRTQHALRGFHLPWPASDRNLASLIGISTSRAGSKTGALMLKFVCVASAFLALSMASSEARSIRAFGQAPGCNVTMPCDFSTSQSNRPYAHTSEPRRFSRRQQISSATGVGDGQIVSGRPAGCPRSFCGCGASLRVFGRIVPELNLASNWLRFPRTAPAPGMVAARHGHVFVLEAHVEGDTWIAYDANSGGHATRIHARSLRGYTIVNPRAA
jgi:hypothetical protein